jgi:hypothetical protein
MSRLNLCLKYNVIPFLHRHSVGTSDHIAISTDIMGMMKKYDIRNIITLKDIADEMDFEYKKMRINDRSIWAASISKQKFVKMLNGTVGTD